MEELDLKTNRIKNTDVLKKFDFKKLKELALGITNINILKEANFPELISLSISSSGITDINTLLEVNFKKLEFYI